ncbi:MAG: hypothetical protein FWC71_04555 [Defluviitaleaceae bacterium]|nr:hypothetical protein [Defluviitaleaceae bacterium]
MPARLALLVKEFERLGLPHDVYHTRAPLDGRDKARELCERNPDCAGIIGMGGDGTIQEIADGMHAAFPQGKIGVPLGIFPAGSGNDFVMTQLDGKKNALTRYKKKNLPQAARLFAQTVKEGRIRSIDLPIANGTAYMNIGNMGLDARIVHNALKFKERWGRYAYVAAVYKSIAQHSNVPLTVEVNGEVIDDGFTLVAICNGQYYGGGLHIAPKARVDDGKFTLCLVRGMSRPKTMLIFPSLMIAQHHRLKTVSFIECNEVTFTLHGNIEVLCLDGNLYPQQKGQSIHFTLRPSALDIYV